MTIAGFRDSRDSVRESEMIVKDEAEVMSWVGGIEWAVLYFSKLSF